MLKKALAVGAIVVAMASFAAAHPHRGFRDGERRGPMLLEQLDLTDAQKAKVAQLREEQQAAMRSLREALEKKAVEFRNLADSDDPRAAAAREQMREIREEMAARRIAHRVDVKKLLTPEQQEKLEALRQQRPGRPRPD